MGGENHRRVRRVGIPGGKAIADRLTELAEGVQVADHNTDRGLAARLRS
ncbi:hypothetical protein [Nocardia spumae]|nr:hypothetical protein [Nocardia spumae]